MDDMPLAIPLANKIPRWENERYLPNGKIRSYRVLETGSDPQKIEPQSCLDTKIERPLSYRPREYGDQIPEQAQ